MSLINKINILTDEGFDGFMDIRKLKGMLNKDEELIDIIGIETVGKGDYDMVLGLTPSRVIICDAGSNSRATQSIPLSELKIYASLTPKKYARINVNEHRFKLDSYKVATDFVEKCNIAISNLNNI